MSRLLTKYQHAVAFSDGRFPTTGCDVRPSVENRGKRFLAVKTPRGFAERRELAQKSREREEKGRMWDRYESRREFSDSRHFVGACTRSVYAFSIKRDHLLLFVFERSTLTNVKFDFFLSGKDQFERTSIYNVHGNIVHRREKEKIL